jgi:hypothetical protein
VSYIQRFYVDRKTTLIYGAMRDKAVVEMTAILFPAADSVIATARPTRSGPRVRKQFRDLSERSDVRIAQTVAEALQWVKNAGPDEAVFVTGSLFMVAEAGDCYNFRSAHVAVLRPVSIDHRPHHHPRHHPEGTISLLVSLFDSDGAMQHRISRIWSRMLLAVSGVKMRVTAWDKIDPHGAYVFVSNHRSLMDTPVVLAHIPLQFRFLAKKGGFFPDPHLRNPSPQGRSLAGGEGRPRASLRSMSDAAKIIRERGISVLLFPEGGRSADDTLQEFREGAGVYRHQSRSARRAHRP